ncbi:MAG: AAA family ATPase [Verrucomicrobiota bacterium]
MNQTVALRGVMLLSGGNGMGKSTLVGRWVRQLENRLYTPVNLTQATLSSSGLLASLARGVGKRASMRRERNLDELSSYLSEHDRRTLVIILDDAQNSSHSTLEELRLLLGLNLPSQPTFALVLIGDEYLLGQLQLRNHRPLFRLGAIICSPPGVWRRSRPISKPGWKPWGSIARRSSSRRRWISWCARRRECRAQLCLLARAAWLEAARAEVQEISAQTMQLAMEQVPRLTGLTRHSMIQRIQQAHALYCQLTGQRVSLRFGNGSGRTLPRASMKPTFKVIRCSRGKSARDAGMLERSNFPISCRSTVSKKI